MCIAESELNVLSATGRFRTRDADANGYAREGGFVSVIPKRLSSPIQDGDHIECIIRDRNKLRWAYYQCHYVKQYYPDCFD